MPRYSSDGTTQRRIKARYSTDGTTERPIKQRYSFDGTTERLVFSSAPEYLFNSGDNTEWTGGWAGKVYNLGAGNSTYTINSTSLQQKIGTNGNSTKRIAIYTKKKVDFGGIKSVSVTLNSDLTIYCNDTNTASWGINKWGIALSSLVPNSDISNTWAYSSVTSATSAPTTTTLTFTARTRTLNTVSVTGSYYVVLLMDVYDTFTSSTATITKVLCT